MEAVDERMLRVAVYQRGLRESHLPFGTRHLPAGGPGLWGELPAGQEGGSYLQPFWTPRLAAAPKFSGKSLFVLVSARVVSTWSQRKFRRRQPSLPFASIFSKWPPLLPVSSPGVGLMLPCVRSALCAVTVQYACNESDYDRGRHSIVEEERGVGLQGLITSSRTERRQPAAPPKAEEPKPSESKPEPKAESSKSELPSGDRIFASPIAKKIALERGIPLAKVKGTGPDGRIIREDVESYTPAAAPAATAAQPAAAQLPLDYVDAPISNMRRTIGTRLTQSKQELPHYYVTSEINMDKTLDDKDKSAKLSVNDFILKAVSCALADVPEANSAWLGEVIRTYKKADISVAVATPTGLITPIVRDVGGKGLASISAETKALAKKARDGKLAPAEYQGGTFTVSNLGMYDVSHFTAIINPPQSCILAVEERGFKTAQIMKVTLSSDHRTVDGAGYLENPLTFML
ncbi:pyruvate dehydrogenase complex dihydrolipoamide acetyltransferase [Salix suchowensis]|nr:pyruvate dehydrogenase complex dihydrolipoamide acetyltransferase [Salix suchowensis]